MTNRGTCQYILTGMQVVLNASPQACLIIFLYILLIHELLYIDQLFRAPNISEHVNHRLRVFTFTWNVASFWDCPAIHYNILASNCGSCPTTTNHTNAICTDVPVNDVCTFAVQIVVCGNTQIGYLSDTIHIALVESESCSSTCLGTSTGDSPENIGQTAFTGSVASAALLGGIIGACITIFIFVIIQRKTKAQCHDN